MMESHDLFKCFFFSQLGLRVLKFRTTKKKSGNIIRNSLSRTQRSHERNQEKFSHKFHGLKCVVTDIIFEFIKCVCGFYHSLHSSFLHILSAHPCNWSMETLNNSIDSNARVYVNKSYVIKTFDSLSCSARIKKYFPFYRYRKLALIILRVKIYPASNFIRWYNLLAFSDNHLLTIENNRNSSITRLQSFDISESTVVELDINIASV